MGVLYANFADCIKNMTYIGAKIHEVDITDESKICIAASTSSTNDVNIWFLPSPIFGSLKGKNVVWAFFESNVLPDTYINYYNTADQVWAPSNWAKKILISVGVNAEKINVVPCGVCPATFNPYHPRINTLGKGNKFRFLTIGKYEDRKGYEQLFDAFKIAFGNDSNVDLIIKADCFANTESKRRQLKSAINYVNLSNIRIADGAYTLEEMVELYAYADCFVYPSKAEGWGLPLIEAIACGLPVMSTNYSGQSEYLSKIEGLYTPLNYELVPIESSFKQLWSIEDKNDAFWAQVKVDEFAIKLKEQIEKQSERRNFAMVASNVIRTDFTWQKSVDAGIGALLSII